MVINWYGEGCFKIQTGGLTLLTDPFDSKIGLTPPRSKFDISLKTLTPWPAQKEGEGSIVGPGEYEMKGVTVRGFALEDESSDKFIKTVYKVETEDISLGFLGHISDELKGDAFEALTGLGIIFMPAGGKPFISPEKAAKLLKQLKPKIVVTSFFKVPKLKRSSGDYKKFAAEIGQKPEVMEKLAIRKKEVAEQKGMRLIVLKV